MDIIERLRTRWLESGIDINTGTSQAAISRFEQVHNFKLPEIFKEYLLAVNGMKDGETDEYLISFLSLNTIDQDSCHKTVSATAVDLVFAEFSIYAHYYKLRFELGGEQIAVLAADGTHERQIADSFAEFLNNYLEDPSKVAYCWGQEE